MGTQEASAAFAISAVAALVYGKHKPDGFELEADGGWEGALWDTKKAAFVSPGPATPQEHLNYPMWMWEDWFGSSAKVRTHSQRQRLGQLLSHFRTGIAL